MTLPLLIVGLILVLAGPWFADQETVGWVLTVTGGLGLLIQLLFFGVAAKAVSNTKRRW